MILIFSLYSGALLLFCTIAASLMFASFKVSGNKGCLFAMASLAFCALDCFLLIVGDALDYYPGLFSDEIYIIGFPLMMSLTSTGFVSGIWLLVCRYFNESHTVLTTAPPALFLCASLIIAFAGEDTNVMEFIYFACKQIFLLGVAGYAFLKYKHLPEGPGKINFKKYAPIIAAFTVLALATIAEDASCVLFENCYEYLGETYLAYYLTERNFSSDFFVLLFGFLCIKRSMLHLNLRNVAEPTTEKPNVKKEMAVIMPRFQNRYGLTPRETEILEQVLRSKNNQEIATELFIAVGTVKAHVHNLLAKTGCSNRQEIKKSFWSL